MRKLLWIPAVLCGMVAIYGAADLIQAPAGSKVMALLLMLAVTLLLARAAAKKRNKKAPAPDKGKELSPQTNASSGKKAISAVDILSKQEQTSKTIDTLPKQTEVHSMQEIQPIKLSVKITTPTARKEHSEEDNKRSMKGESIIQPIAYYVALDIETTGLSPSDDEIIEISAVRVHDNEIVERFSSLVKPSQPISARITELTGITNEMLSDAPPIEQVLPAFRSFIGNYVLVGHNVNFDINFLYDHSLRIGLDAVTNDYLDTLRLSRQLYPGEKHHRLSDLIERFGVGDIVAHRAMSDVLQTKACYDVMRVALKESNPKAFPDASEGVPGAMDDYFRGEELRKAGALDEALALYDAAREKGYESPALYIGYAMAYRKQKEYQKEIDVLTMGIARMEDRHWSAEQLAERKEKAMQLLEKERSAKNAEAEKARIREEKEQKRAEKAAAPETEKKSQKRAILQMDMDMQLIRRFDSIAEAVRETGVNAKSIREAANGNQSHAGGFKWKYDNTP